MKKKISRIKLQSKYEFLNPTDIRNGLMCFGFECDDGWLPLLKETFDNINKVVKKNKLNDFRVTQVKEKFGGLRIYWFDANDEIEKIIDRAEKKSMNICEVCSKKGERRNLNGWYKVLCGECYKKESRRFS